MIASSGSIEGATETISGIGLQNGGESSISELTASPRYREAALRAVIETSARKTKHGSQVREGLMIESVAFRYDVNRYGEDIHALSTST